MKSYGLWAGIGIIVVIGLSFGAYKIIESNRQTQQIVAAQQQTLIAAQQEIKTLAASASSSAIATQKEIPKAQTSAQNTQPTEAPAQPDNATSVDVSEIAPYENGVLYVSCGNDTGSASLWNISGYGYIALTNFHVIASGVADLSQDPNTGCILLPDTEVNTGSFFEVPVSDAQYQTFNSIADEAILPITTVNVLQNNQMVAESPSVLDTKISSLPKCDAKMPLDAPVVVLGFPAYAMQEITTFGSTGPTYSLIASNGVISGYDVSSTVSGLPDLNYYVSAKIDSGNSGGIAFSMDSQGLCVLGIPTWVSTGNYENEGIVQNIDNVMYQQ